MSDFLGIRIQSVIEDSKQIQAKLDTVLKSVKGKISISDIDIDNKAISRLQTLLDSLNNSTKGMSIPLSDFKSVLSDIEKIKLNNLSQNLGNLNKTQIKIIDNEQVQQIQTYNREIGETIKITKDLKNQDKKPITVVTMDENEFKKMSNATELFTKKMEINIQELKRKYSDLIPTSELNSLKNRLGNLNLSVDNKTINSYKELQNELKKVEIEYKQLQANTKSNGLNLVQQDSRSFLSTIQKDLVKFSEYFLAGGFVVGIINGVKQGVQSIIELDSAMIDLKKVTNETSSTYNNFLIEANQNAIALGHSTKDVIEATADFSRMGYEFKNAKQMASDAIIYSNVGDVDIKTATTDLISTMKGFGLESSKTTDIIDKLNEVKCVPPYIVIYM